MKDSLGVDIRPDDRVMVTAWGTARLIDTGTTSPVVRIGRTRVVIIDSTRDERAVNPRELAVLRRDGEPGFEGNAARRCTCGALDFNGCFCGVTVREFLASGREGLRV